MLVNVWSSKEIKVCFGLKQGDSLASFFFLTVVEGLVGILSEASNKGFVDIFRVDDDDPNI